MWHSNTWERCVWGLPRGNKILHADQSSYKENRSTTPTTMTKVFVARMLTAEARSVCGSWLCSIFISFTHELCIIKASPAAASLAVMTLWSWWRCDTAILLETQWWSGQQQGSVSCLQTVLYWSWCIVAVDQASSVVNDNYFFWAPCFHLRSHGSWLTACDC